MVDLVPGADVFFEWIEEVERVIIREVDIHHVAVKEFDIGQVEIRGRLSRGCEQVASLFHSGEPAVHETRSHETELAWSASDIQNARVRCSDQ